MVAVLLHLYHQKLWPYFKAYLYNIHHPFDLYVNLTDERLDDNLRTTADIMNAFPTATVFVSPNLHRDIGGFLTVLNHIFDSGKTYESALFLHSKMHTDEWRTELVQALLDNPERVDYIIETFKQSLSVGMVGCRKWLFDDGLNGGFGPEQAHYLNCFNLRFVSGQFIAGTMFWARWCLFANTFGKRRITHADLTPNGPWVMERVFGNLVRSQNYDIVGI
jgi:hypothetical protein